MYLIWGNLHKFLFNLAGKFLMIMMDQIGLTYNRIMELQGLLFIDILLLKVFEKKVLINPLETIFMPDLTGLMMIESIWYLPWNLHHESVVVWV